MGKLPSRHLNQESVTHPWHASISRLDFCPVLATKVVQTLIIKLPADGRQKEPSSDVVVNICGALNNLVTGSSLAARDINYFDGLPKLVGIKSNHDGR